MKTFRTHVAAAMLLVPMAAALVASPAAAQHRVVVAQPAIAGLTLNADHGLAPGSVLQVQLNATPGARWSDVTLGASGVRIALREQVAGRYVGRYVVRNADRIDPTQHIAARAAYGDRAVTARFTYPPSFQSFGMGAAPARDLIERFTLRHGGDMEPGRELRFRLVGAPGGQAWVDIPGSRYRVQLEETRDGVYEGRYTMRRRDDPDAIERAVATLERGNLRDTARVEVRGQGRDDDDRWGRDRRDPQISDVTPAHGDRVSERGRVHLSARLSDEGSGVDTASVRLRLNGRDVTSDARLMDDQLRYSNDLAPGRYTAELTVRDRSGNTAQKSWTFDVVERDRWGGYEPHGLPLQLTSHGNNTVVDANGQLVLQGRTAPYASVRVQVESISSVGGLLGLTQQVADQTVQADRNGYFSTVVAPRTALPLPGTRYEVRLTASSGGQTAEERVSLLQRQG
jgi:hypothetical protein